MGDLSKFDIYKILGTSQSGYIFSIIENEDTEEPTYRYYMVTPSDKKTPIIKRLNNTIEILSSENIILEKIEIESEELLRFAKLITDTQLPRQSELKKEPQNYYFSAIKESDYQLIKHK